MYNYTAVTDSVGEVVGVANMSGPPLQRQSGHIYSADDRTYELLWIRVGSLIVGALYCPPRSQYKVDSLLDYVEACVQCTVRPELLLLQSDHKAIVVYAISPYLDIKRSTRNYIDRFHRRSTHSFCNTSQLLCQLMLITGQIWTFRTLLISSVMQF